MSKMFTAPPKKEFQSFHDFPIITDLDNFEADILGGLNNGFNAIHLNTNKQPVHKRCIIIEDLITLTEIL